MTEIVRAGQLSISIVQSAGDGTPGTAAAVVIPTSHSVLLVEMPQEGLQAIKLPAGHPGDTVEIYGLSKCSSGSVNTTKFSVFDADNNGLVGTSTSHGLSVGSRMSITKILSSDYSVSGFDTNQIGTWQGYEITAVGNIASS